MSPRKFAAAALLTLSGGVTYAQTSQPATNPAGRTIVVSEDKAAPVMSAATAQGCGPGGCNSGAPCITMNCDDQCGGRRTYASAEYLWFFQKDAPVGFPVATVSPLRNQGVVGVPGTMTVLGDGDVDHGHFSGGRITVGTTLNQCGTLGIEGSAFLLESVTRQETVTGNPNDVLARPFMDANVGQENSRLLMSPGSFNGTATLSTFNRVWGAEVDPILRVRTTCDSALDFVTGFKFLSLEESLDIYDQSTSQGNGLTSFNTVGIPGPGVTTSVFDRFSTQNRFYGGIVGGRYRYRTGRAEIALTGKVALGTVHQAVASAGTTTLSGMLPEPMTVTGGLLAVGSNLGRESKHVFGVLPEAQVKVSYCLTDSLSIFAGYNFMYLSTVVRPGDNVSRSVNPTLIPTSPTFAVPFGPAQPAPQFNTSDWWAHGASFGVALTF